MGFLRFFLTRTLLVNIMLVGIFGLAFAAATSTNRNEFPDVDLATMQVITLYPGASPKDVEQNVTRLIEDELKGVTGIDNFKSVSGENVSSVTIEIDIDYPDQKAVKDDVRRAIDRVSDLPTEIEGRPVVRDLKASERPVLIVGVSGENASYGELRRIAKLVERDLKRIRGVSQIDKYGFRDLEFHVDLDPARLDQKYIALNDVLFALDSRNVRATGGNLESFRTQRNILTLSQFETTKDVENVIIRSAFGGGDVSVKEVATVTEGFSEEMMRTIFDGRRGIMLVVKKASNQDIITVVDKIRDYIGEKQKILPENITLSAANDASGPVRNRISVVVSNAIIGFVLVIIILIIFLDLRSSLLIALSIPTAFAITFLIMPTTGVDINAISLMAMIIALGMIVDQSIVVSENSIVHIKQGEGVENTVEDGVLSGTMEVVLPVVASVLTTVLAFAPMFAMSGVMGKFVATIPTVIIASLIGSLFSCFLILPNHLSNTIRPPEPEPEPKGESESKSDANESEDPGEAKTWQDRFFDNIAVPYKKTLPLVLRHRYITTLVAVALLFFSMWWAGRNVTFNLFPPDGADTFFVYVELTDDATFEATEEVIEKIEAYIEEIPEEELAYYTARIGTNQSNELAAPAGGDEYLAFLQVTLVPHSARDRDAEIVMHELREKVKANISGTKELRFELKKPGPPAGKPIELRVHSDNDEDRAFFVKRIVADLEAMKGVSDVTTTQKIGREEFKLDIDYKTLAAVGLTVQDVAGTLRIAFDGIDATSIVRNNEEIDIRARFPQKHRQNVQNVLNLNIRNNQGNLIPVRAFASLSRTRAETSIHHTDGDVTTTINAQSDVTVQPQRVITKLIQKYSPELIDYPEVSFSYGGEAEKTQESVRSLLLAFIGGVVAIYLVLTLLFNSLSQPIIVLTAIPFGLIGVIWAFYFHDRPFSFMGLVGVIGLSGIVVNNSLMMVEFINKLVVERLAAGRDFVANDLIPDVVAGASRRLRPIVITTITTVTGLLPTAYGIGGSDPFLEPMVLAIAWGLILSTQISLFLIPAFYMNNLDALLFAQKAVNFVGERASSILQRIKKTEPETE
ncbi:MAG: efflux RND transporter permease subunit [bacterium]|nr:efflux RND transporter permease subunit [bacterium]